MERVNGFLLDDSGSSEAASSVMMIAGVGGVLLLAAMAYYGAMSGFFQKAQAWMQVVGNNLH